MTKYEKDLQEEKEIIEETIEEIQDIKDETGDINEEKLEEASSGDNPELIKYKELLARQQADYENFKKRVDRDKQDMVFFLKQDILKKILPRLDDLERIVKNTPEDLQKGVLFEGIVTLEKTLKKDFESLGVKAFDSIGSEVSAEKHDVMTTISGKKEGIICDEFEKGYMLQDRVLRPAKVVVGAGE